MKTDEFSRDRIRESANKNSASHVLGHGAISTECVSPEHPVTTCESGLSVEDALNMAESGDRSENDPLSVLAVEVKRLRTTRPAAQPNELRELRRDKLRMDLLSTLWVRLNEEPAVYGWDRNIGSNKPDLREAVDTAIDAARVAANPRD